MSDRLVYGLADPRSGEYRYAGLSTRGMARPNEHLRRAPTMDRTHRANWLRNLKGDGLQPEIVVLQTCETDEELSKAEDYWIRLLRIAGHRLTNHQSGGFSGWRMDDATRSKIANAMLGARVGEKHPMFGKKHTPATVEKISRTMTGRVVSLETRAKQSVASKGRTLSAESRAKISQTLMGNVPWNKGLKVPQLSGENNPMFGRKHTAESVQKISDALRGRTSPNKGKPMSEATRAKLSAAKRGVQQRCSLCGELGHRRTTCIAESR